MSSGLKSRMGFAALIVFLLGGCTLPFLPGSSRVTTQLPRAVRPLHYTVSVTPDATALKFTGDVAIEIEVLEATNSITLNAADLNIRTARLAGVEPGKGGPGTPVIETDATAQTARFVFSQPVAPGHYQLALNYDGNIATQAYGLFAIDYQTADGPRRALYTQFENSDARRMLPCWDEPAFKATFVLEVNAPGGQMAVSNTPIASTEDSGGGNTRIRFAPTPRMSAYLLFLALGDFQRNTTVVDGVEIGVVAQRGSVAKADFVLASTRDIVRAYDDYFDTRYPLPKLDNVAAPGSSQFFAAMENWGAILTFESAILLDPTISTQADKQFVYVTAAHEVAHQWVGNLVTMQWWDDIWLNEGFASWISERITTRLHPEWNTALQAVGLRERAMDLDALATTHPVVQHVETVEQANQAFDGITYQKGEAVIRMLEAYVGEEAWRAGVRSYVKAHAYGNAVSEDLWRAIEGASNQPVTAMARDFTLQPGVPLIRVAGAGCAAGKTTLRLTQGEFSNDEPDRKPLAWRVPVVAAAMDGGAAVRVLVAGGSATVTVPGCAPVIVNAGQSGYYRTLYAPEQFAGIAGNFAALAPIDQLGILADSWSLALAGLQPVSDFLNLTRVTPADADPQVWRTIARVARFINDAYAAEPIRQAAFQRTAIALLQPVFAASGWIAKTGEASTLTILRNDLIETLGALGDADVIAESRRRFAARATDSSALPAALRKSVLGVVARHADERTWEVLHAAASAEKTQLIRAQRYELLAATTDASLARRTLELALTPEPGATISPQLISTVAVLHPDLAFDFAIAHLAAVMNMVDSPSRSRFMPALASRSADPAMIAKIRNYAAANLAVSSRAEAERAASKIAFRVMVRKERLPAIDSWLRNLKHDG